MRQIKLIIIHCSDSPDDRRSVDVPEIRRWHKERGFSDIGYHFVILKSGTIDVGRPVEKIGAHCLGHNNKSIGICWVGRNDCNAAQRRSLITHISYLLATYNLPVSAVLGHKEFESGKTCPNLDMDALRSDIERYQRGKL